MLPGGGASVEPRSPLRQKAMRRAIRRAETARTVPKRWSPRAPAPNATLCGLLACACRRHRSCKYRKTGTSVRRRFWAALRSRESMPAGAECKHAGRKPQQKIKNKVCTRTLGLSELERQCSKLWGREVLISLCRVRNNNDVEGYAEPKQDEISNMKMRSQET